MNPSSALLQQAAELLAPLDRRPVFLGGATVHLHVDDPAAPNARTAMDVSRAEARPGEVLYLG